MSKAFTKETDESDSPDDGDEDVGALPQGFKNYMTPQGAAALREELSRLLKSDRPELVKVITWAASNGDRSENGDYIYGKRRLREIDRRIRFLSKRLDSAEVVDPSQQTSDQVVFGATVKVKNEDDETKTYRIVGIDETDVRNGQVSWISPIAKALLGSKAGDVVTLKTPQGDQDLEIVSVQFQ
ncbi:MAG: transcription elongation factor GreB [Methylotenera sp.]|nr:transcription elongation factor GreB [Oligoflexia bacterium]